MYEINAKKKLKVKRSVKVNSETLNRKNVFPIQLKDFTINKNQNVVNVNKTIVENNLLFKNYLYKT